MYTSLLMSPSFFHQQKRGRVEGGFTLKDQSEKLKMTWKKIQSYIYTHMYSAILFNTNTLYIYTYI